MNIKVTIPGILAVCFFAYVWFSMTKSSEQIKVSNTVLCEDGSGKLAVAYTVMHRTIDKYVGCATQAQDKVSITWNDGETETYDDSNSVLNYKDDTEVTFNAIALRWEKAENEIFYLAVTDLPCRDKKSFITFLANANGRIIENTACAFNGKDDTVAVRFIRNGEPYEVEGTYNQGEKITRFKADLL